MSDPCIKKKPYRPIRESLFEVCECGHQWGEHGFRLFILTDGECNTCICNRFKSIGKFTYKEWINLKECDKD